MQTKGYWIGHLDVSDPEAHAIYARASTAAIAAFGGRFLVRGGTCEQVEGEARSRHVVIEFDSFSRAQACYHSRQYQAALNLRRHTAVADMAIVEGLQVDGAQL